VHETGVRTGPGRSETNPSLPSVEWEDEGGPEMPIPTGPSAASETPRRPGEGLDAQFAPGSSSLETLGGVCSASFVGLLVTQFLGAVNDNMFRWLVVPIGKEMAGPEGTALTLSLGLACFVLPYIVLAAPAGYLADRFSKRSVIVACKAAEVVLALLGVVAILIGNLYLMFAVVALFGAQSALFGPSKFGCIPEIVRSDRISAANGLIGMTTVLAIVLGTVAGNCLYVATAPLGRQHWWISALALVGVASAGWAASLMIRRLPAADPGRKFPVRLVRETVGDLVHLGSDRSILRAVLGSAVFWALAGLAQMNVDLFAVTELHVGQESVGVLLAILALGVGAGSILAGLISAGRVELGLVPLGAAGMALSTLLLFVAPLAGEPASFGFGWTSVCLFILGASAGVYDVPLQSFIQQRSPAASRGAILAAANFLTFSGMLAAAGLFWVCRDMAGLSARQVFLVLSLIALPVMAYALWLLPTATVALLRRWPNALRHRAAR